MLKNLLNFTSITTLYLFSAHCFADANMKNIAASTSSPPNSTTQSTTQLVSLTSARPYNQKGIGLSITTDWLFWQANESGLSYAIKSTSTNVTTNASTPVGVRQLGGNPILGDAKTKNPEFNWQSGFRFGISYDLPIDGWDLSSYWTWYKDHAIGRASSEADLTQGVLFPLIIDSSITVVATDPFIESAKARLRLNINLIDLEMGREFYTSKWLSLRPHIGLRTAWIYQKYTIEYDNFFNVVTSGAVDGTAPPIFINSIAFSSEIATLKNHYWGLGLRGGLDSDWILGGGWSVYGNAAIALLYGFFDLERKLRYSDDILNVGGGGPSVPGGPTYSSVPNSTLKDFYHATRAILDLQLGLRWDTTFRKGKYGCGFKAGWEHHLFFSQNQFLFPENRNSENNKGDKAVQGFTLSARFDF